MRERVAELMAKWRKLDYELDFGVGIAQGYATIGGIGFEGRWITVRSASSRISPARLCGEAKPSQILVSQRLLGTVEELGGSGTCRRANTQRLSAPCHRPQYSEASANHHRYRRYIVVWAIRR